MAAGRNRTLTKMKKPLILFSFLIFGCREVKDTDKKKEIFNIIFVLELFVVRSVMIHCVRGYIDKKKIL